MYKENNPANEHHIEQMLNHTPSSIANYKNLLSQLPGKNEYQHRSILARIESARQHLADHSDKLSAAKEQVLETITKIEHDYGKLCDDMGHISSDSARAQYDQAVCQLENAHRRKLSLYEVIALDISKIQGAISSGYPAGNNKGPKPLAGRKSIKKSGIDESRSHIDSPEKTLRTSSSDGLTTEVTEEDTEFIRQADLSREHSGSANGINKPAADKDLNDLCELDLLGSGKRNPSKPNTKNEDENIVKAEKSVDEIIKRGRSFSIFDNSTNRLVSVPYDNRESLPKDFSGLKEYLADSAGKMEDALADRSYKELDYAPQHVDDVIDHTHTLSGHLNDYCKNLAPIKSLEMIDHEIEDQYAVKEDYQRRLYSALGLLYEYRQAAESELRWVKNNKKISKESMPEDALLTLASPEILTDCEKQHTTAIKKIDAELKTLETLIGQFDKKSFPYREPERSTDRAGKDNKTELLRPKIKKAPPPDDKENEKTQQARKIIGGRSSGSAIYTYIHRSWRDGGTKDALSATEKCIEHLLKLNAILPEVDTNGHSECIAAESQYALKEKHKLDLIEMTGRLNAHLAELTSEINKLMFRLKSPVKSDDPRFDLENENQQINERLTCYNRTAAQITEMLDKAEAAVIEADRKLWPGEKPREKFDPPKKDDNDMVYISPETMW